MTTLKMVARSGLGALSALGLVLAAGCADDPRPAEPIGEAPVQLESPAPVTGGTLLVTKDGQRAVIADTDMNQAVVVDLTDMKVLHTLPLGDDAEPGRVVEGADGIAYVALRRAGDVVAINLDSGEMTPRAVCAAPRGMAYDGSVGALHVACAGGELVSLQEDLQGAPIRELKLDYDIRDVVLGPSGRLLVSQFRSSHVFLVDENGSVLNETAPSNFLNLNNFTPAVAWNMKQTSGGQVVMIHQRGSQKPVAIEPPPEEAPEQSSYGGGGGEFCTPGIVHAATTFFDKNGINVSNSDSGGLGSLVLPVDFALSPDETRMAVVGAGSDVLFTTTVDRARNTDRMNDFCQPNSLDTEVAVPGEPVAVSYLTDNSVLVQTRQPAMLKLIEPNTGKVLQELKLPGPDRRNWGHALFHKAASDNSAISCASCHPEGRDDGRVWNFMEIGARRTQTMSGGVMNTMPLHWDGDMTDLHELMGDVFVNRMGGAEQPVDRIEAMGTWMNGVRAVPNSTPFDQDAAVRGGELFNSSAVGCANCHSGPNLTNNASADVGTGKAFQVPALNGIAHRAPFMHDGCAPTLMDRFTNTYCGGGDAHGNTSQLDQEQLNDLVAYLETL